LIERVEIERRRGGSWTAGGGGVGGMQHKKTRTHITTS